MAAITEIKRKDGRTAYKLRFYRNGERQCVSFDASYTRQDVELASTMIEAVLIAERHGNPVDRVTSTYFEHAPLDLQRRFTACGIIAARRVQTLGAAWQEFFEEKCETVAPSTQQIWRTIGQRLMTLFDSSRVLRSITEHEAKNSRKRLSEVYAEATVCTTIGRFRTFWLWAIDRGIVDVNIYAGVKKGSDVNRTKDFQIPAEWTERILDACPSQNWRTLTALWRVGGLRQQEPLLLTWECVNWEHKRLLVPSPKTSRYEGRESRLIPLFPVLERELQASFEIAKVGEPFIIPTNRRQNFDSGFKRILFFAGLTPWTKLFQNMRASAENDLIEAGYPEHVVGAWLGHTKKVQNRHYLRVLDEYFNRATMAVPVQSETVPETVPVTIENKVQTC